MRMKKIVCYFSYIVIAIFITFLAIDDNKAAITNPCTSGSNDCAFCVYEFGDFSNTQFCHLKFAVVYKAGNNSGLQYLEDSSSKRTSTTYTSCTFNYRYFTKNDFNIDGATGCPKLTKTLKTSSSGARNQKIDYTFKVNSKGEMSALTTESKIIKGTGGTSTGGNTTDKDETTTKTPVCNYDSVGCGDYTLSKIDGSLIIYDRDGEHKIEGDADLATGCPRLETYHAYIPSENIDFCRYSLTKFDQSSTSKSGKLVDQNNGESIEPEGETLGDPSKVMIPNKVEKINICEKDHVLLVFQVLGYILFVAKIVIPLLLIIMGSIDFAKAIIDSDEKAIKDAIVKFIKRFIAGVIIFFLPTIFNFIFSLVDGAVDNQKNFTGCTNCIFDPLGKCGAEKLVK